VGICFKDNRGGKQKAFEKFGRPSPGLNGAEEASSQLGFVSGYDFSRAVNNMLEILWSLESA
jgi:hypothetical protein